MEPSLYLSCFELPRECGPALDFLVFSWRCKFCHSLEGFARNLFTTNLSCNLVTIH